MDKNEFNVGGNPVMDLHRIQGGGRSYIPRTTVTGISCSLTTLHGLHVEKTSEIEMVVRLQALRSQDTSRFLH